MQMNDIIDGLNSCECPDYPPVNPGGMVGNCGVNGCGFGSWIWILLILFYSNAGACGGNTGYGCAQNSCGCGGGYGQGGLFCGLGNCGGGYLFLLVILFLCNGCNGCNGVGNGFGYGTGFDGACGGLY